MPSYRDSGKVEPISEVEGSRPGAHAIDSEGEAKRSDFDAALKKAEVLGAEEGRVPPRPAPVEVPQDQKAKETIMDLAKKASQEVPRVAPTPDELGVQATRLHQRMQVVTSGLMRLQGAGAEMPSGAVPALTAHIEHIDRGLRDVAKLTRGVEVGAVRGVGEGKPPLVRFLTYLTESDKGLNRFIDELGGLKIGEQKLTPDVLMAVQIKLGFITQELEFFTATLNKALESTKTVMNIQI